MKMQMKSDEKLYFCVVFVNNQHLFKEISKKMYHLNAFDQNVSFHVNQTDYIILRMIFCTLSLRCFHRDWFEFEFMDGVYFIYHVSVFNLNPFPNKPWFLRVRRTSLLKTLWEKEKLLVTSNFSFSHSVFYPFRELSAIFIKFELVVCKLTQF